MPAIGSRRDSRASTPHIPSADRRSAFHGCATVLERYPSARVIIELKTPDAGAGAPDDRRRPRGARARSRRPRLVSLARAERGAPLRARAFRPAPPAKRRGGRCTARGCAGRSVARNTASFRCPSDRARPSIVTPRSSRTRTGPACQCGSGRSTIATTCCACSTGAPTASSAIVPTSLCQLCGSGLGQTGQTGQTASDPGLTPLVEASPRS